MTEERRLEEAFQNYERTVRVKNYRTCIALTIVFMLAGSSLDWIVYGVEGARKFLPVRLVSVALLVIGRRLLMTQWGERVHRVLGLVLAMPLIGGISWMIAMTEGDESPYYAGLNLVLLGAAILMRWPLIDSIILVVLTLTTYLTACYAHGPIDNLPIFFNNCYFLGVTGVLTAAGTWMYNRIRFSEFSLRHHLDVSRNKLENANEMLESNNRRLRELDEAKGRFFANISHELRTPLTLLIAPLESLMKREGVDQDEEEKELISTMHANAMRLLKLINDLLDLVRLESGKMPIRPHWVDIPTFIAGQAAAVRKHAEQRNVALEFHTDSSLSRAMLDEEKLDRICLNLLLNAFKFTPSGGHVKFSAKRDGTWLVLQVQDTGVGINAEQLPHIFGRFWQADTSAQRKHQGLGIGLALVKDIAEAHGGSVLAESKIGEGTIMTVRLPLVETDENTSAPSPPDALTSPPSSTESLAPNEKIIPTLQSRLRPITLNPAADTPQKPRLLVADDEPDLLRYLTLELSNDFNVTQAVDGAQAVDKALASQFDIILCDMMMPEKDGLQVCRELRGHSSTLSIPIVLLTARVDEKTKIDCLAAGANDFISKPFSLAELIVRLRNLVTSHIAQRRIIQQKEQLENALAQLKETELLLVRNEKLASLGRLSAGLIHEINNPLHYAKQALYVLRRSGKSLDKQEKNTFNEIVQDIEGGIDRVSGIISDLRGFVSVGSAGAEVFNLKRMVETVLRFFSVNKDNGTNIEVEIPEYLELRGHRNHLLQVLINLVQNSLDALSSKTFQPGESPRVTISADARDEGVTLRIHDNGPGIESSIQNLIFDPFFTTKEVGQGMGLGLAITHRIITEQGGHISVRSEAGHFCEVVIDLPSIEKQNKLDSGEPPIQ